MPYNFLRQLVYARSNNVLDPAHDYLFETRLARLMRERGMSQVEELVEHLRMRRNPDLEWAIAEAMTINETSFFRDIRPFELLRAELLPRLIEKRRQTKRLRFWSAACSTGQEAYSLAMLVREHFPFLSAWDLRIEGTDIASQMVARAGAGKYGRLEMNRGLPARNLVRFFNRDGEDWVVKDEIRQLCRFRQVNLCRPPIPFSEQFDVILLRNVMLYFSRETRHDLMRQVHRLLAPDGVLFLGAAEQPADLSLWQTCLGEGTCYYKPKGPV
jgi:chemotaxis protein methyltransferase CheR